MHQLQDWIPNELHGQMNDAYQLEDRQVGEIDGIEVDSPTNDRGYVRHG